MVSSEQVAYIACNDLIKLANEIFGASGWSSSVTHLQQEFVRSSILQYFFSNREN
jgi:recombination DNA repair RAD52 pathway protein